jgi:hypothetical protein
MIAPFGRRAAVPSLEEVVVIALAAQRLARAISTDTISAPVRGRLSRWVERTPRRGAGALAHSLEELVNCPVCTGWWTSLAMSAVWPGPARLRRGVSVAGAQVVLTLLERLVSEQGRAAIHHADISEVHSEVLAGSSAN